MLDFHKYLMRHGEFGVQSIIEQIERVEGIRSRTDVPLESRWAALMQAASAQQPQRLAA